MRVATSQQAQQSWRYCGGQIKLWREEAGVARQMLADEAGYDYEYVKLIGSNCPPLDEETVEERVAARLKRQEKLGRKPLTYFSFVIHEAVLRSVVGEQDVMRGQCAHLRYAFVDGQSTGALHSDGDKLSTLTQRYGMIRMQALSVEESAQFIRKVAEEL
ncbi:Scr1 family TA system antitoxin-like transcriptional regulator [Streptomyces justiciae]|uniref:Scr1 family TA system antitoxin-like transcriptional regulator n=1 Tax=Streptomyces justiciae TaxID=2780140 RepID=A0ABU3M513_9ACTN|nr:Scr1 family TA system antitoxin-like transcriptional regulator [Streptomyces justiciae]MDT7846606.1 Scr1 family TA system antitoxin-like transcriptional regulator [Streptomyces justiciae]